jgi:hypothetical protein
VSILLVFEAFSIASDYNERIEIAEWDITSECMLPKPSLIKGVILGDPGGI